MVAQQETRRETLQDVSIEIYLMNEHRVSVNIKNVEQTDSVLEKVCEELSIPEQFHYCFSLYLIRRDTDGDITVVRKLQDFESPFISQKALSSSLDQQNDEDTGQCQ